MRGLSTIIFVVGLLMVAQCHRKVSRPKASLLKTLSWRPKVSALYRFGNRTCIKCDPGFFVINHCTIEGKQADCAPCPPGTYTRQLNRARKCLHCKDCYENNSEIRTRCTSTSNTKCICLSGFGVISSDETHHSLDCVDCTVRNKISVFDADKGERFCVDLCPEKKFYEEETATCKECTVCERSGNLTKIPCTLTSDAVCESPSPSSATTLKPEGEKESDGLSGSSIAAIVIVPVLLAAVIGLVCWYRKYKSSQTQSTSFQQPPQEKLLVPGDPGQHEMTSQEDQEQE